MKSVAREREHVVNSSKYRKHGGFIGDLVLLNSHKRASKFDSVYFPEPYHVASSTKHGRMLSVVHLFLRHPDYVKQFKGFFPDKQRETMSEEQEVQEWHRRFTTTLRVWL